MTEVTEGLTMEILINASSIGGKIESMLTNAKSDVTLISPYIQLEKDEESKWDAISRAIHVALKKEHAVHVYARKDDETSGKKLLDKFKEFQGTKLTLHVVPNLHAKLYFTKDEALICSMNMYRYSMKSNHEIGVALKRVRGKDTPISMEKMAEIENFTTNLDSDAELVQFEADRKARVELSQKSPDGIESVQFIVLSRGYKWYKVLTPEGYENKILIEGTQQLKDGRNYTAKAKLIWHRSAYGVEVEFAGLHDVAETKGYCLNCRKPVKAEYAYCFDCNAAKETAALKPRYCKRCGRAADGITMQKRKCADCYARFGDERQVKVI